MVIQSGEFAASSRRLVIPLAKDTGAAPAFAPRFTIEGVPVVADALQLFSVPTSQLGTLVASLADDTNSSALIDIIDRVISRAYTSH